jgi:hypothetical protein
LLDVLPESPEMRCPDFGSEHALPGSLAVVSKANRGAAPPAIRAQTELGLCFFAFKSDPKLTLTVFSYYPAWSKRRSARRTAHTVSLHAFPLSKCQHSSRRTRTTPSRIILANFINQPRSTSHIMTISSTSMRLPTQRHPITRHSL